MLLQNALQEPSSASQHFFQKMLLTVNVMFEHINTKHRMKFYQKDLVFCGGLKENCPKGVALLGVMDLLEEVCLCGGEL